MVTLPFPYLRNDPTPGWYCLGNCDESNVLKRGHRAIANIAIILMACTPVEFNWDKTITTGVCHPITVLWVVTGSVNFIADVIVLVLPMPSIYKLQLATYRKVTLMITFGIGFM